MNFKINIHSLIDGHDRLPTLPEVYFRLKELIDDPNSSFEEIGEILGHDAGLSVRLLRIVNSPYFGFRSKIDSISYAVSAIGMDQLANLVLSTVVVDQFRGIPDSLINMRSFWEHSLACGLAARIIATNRNEPNTERFFVAGLLHDIGRLLICMRIPDKFMASMQRAKSCEKHLYLAEREVMGFDHAQAGALLLKTWNLPQCLEEAVGFHHRPSKARNHRLEASVIHIADIVANTLQLGSGGENDIPTLDSAARELTEMGESLFFSAIMKDVVKQFEQAARLFLQFA